MSATKMEEAVEIKSRFSTADAEYPSIAFKDGTITVEFLDWQEKQIRVSFANACAVKWQEVSSQGPESRDDTTYEIHNSRWVAEHLSQGARTSHENIRHFKLCFNACGVLEVLASEMQLAA